MKKISTSTLLLFLFLSIYSYSQNHSIITNSEGSEYIIEKYDADHPEITTQEYGLIDKRCAENINRLGLDKTEKSTTTVSLEWPVQAAAGFNDCGYYGISAHVDQNTTSGVYQDYNCGTVSYDGHKGTDIFSWPFSFYKMDNNQVEIIAAAAGTIIDKDDGNFDRNCATNSLPANYVIIQHADGSCALYWHMKSGSVTTKAIGQTVVVGEYLGVIGSSGSSTGPHLHFEIWTGATSATYNDPFSGTCNIINGNSWWASQKPYAEAAILKTSVHTTDIVFPGCPTTETPNESTSYTIPFQGPGLSPGYAKFYIFLKNAPAGTVANLKILNPGGSVFNSWNITISTLYGVSYWGSSKLLPTTAGTYTFQAIYNGVTCEQNFDIVTTTGVATIADSQQILIYPNPSNGEFTVDMANGISTSGNPILEIYNVLGEKVSLFLLTTPKSEINPDLPSGIYFYKINDINRIISSGNIAIK